MRLVCVECGATSDDGEHWKAEIAVGLLKDEFDLDGPPEVAVYCPVCWSREFGDACRRSPEK